MLYYNKTEEYCFLKEYIMNIYIYIIIIYCCFLAARRENKNPKERSRKKNY